MHSASKLFRDPFQRCISYKSSKGFLDHYQHHWQSVEQNRVEDISPTYFQGYSTEINVHIYWHGTKVSPFWDTRHIGHDLLRKNLCTLLAILTFFPKCSYYHISFSFPSSIQHPFQNKFFIVFHLFPLHLYFPNLCHDFAFAWDVLFFNHYMPTFYMPRFFISYNEKSKLYYTLQNIS